MYHHMGKKWARKSLSEVRLIFLWGSSDAFDAKLDLFSGVAPSQVFDVLLFDDDLDDYYRP